MAPKEYGRQLTRSIGNQVMLQAGELGRGGEVFVLDMGEPVPAHLNSAIQNFTAAVQIDDPEAIIVHLQRLIPEFKRVKVELAAVNSAS